MQCFINLLAMLQTGMPVSPPPIADSGVLFVLLSCMGIVASNLLGSSGLHGAHKTCLYGWQMQSPSGKTNQSYDIGNLIEDN